MTIVTHTLVIAPALAPSGAISLELSAPDHASRQDVHTQVCPYCQQAKMLLKQRGVTDIEEVRIDVDSAQRDHMMAITGRRTVPQIFIGETHVGGCDDLMDLDQKGGLMPLLTGA